MSFGNKPIGKWYVGNGNLEKTPLNALGLSKPSSDLDALNHLDGLGDLGSPAVNSRKNNGFNMGKLGQDSKHLNDDLRGLNGKNSGNALGKGIRYAGKLNRDAGNPLGSLNNLAVHVHGVIGHWDKMRVMSSMDANAKVIRVGDLDD